MPMIASFYRDSHKDVLQGARRPHSHAIHGEHNGVFDIETLQTIEGDLAKRAERMVREWAERYHEDLMDSWKTREFKELPGLEWDAMSAYPKVKDVEPLEGKMLRVTFDNGEVKTYDCRPLLTEESFRVLESEAYFRCVRADDHGYGVVWSDEVDLAESELWFRGKSKPRSPADG